MTGNEQKPPVSAASPRRQAGVTRLFLPQQVRGTDMTVIGNHEVVGMEGAPRLSEASARDYFELLKPRVMSLVVFTAFAGLVLAPGHINPFIGFTAILCIAIGAGASGALNMWYDADIDAVMSRTAKRPIPAGKILPQEALAFGLTLSAFSVIILGLAVHWLAAGLLAFTIFFYVAIYTMWLKRSTPQNIVIGGAAGAFPPMIGWACVTGGVSVESIVLFLIIFLWTPAHFWALALFKMGDYGAVGVPMMPNVCGEATTKRQIVIYAVLTAVSGVCPTLLGFASLGYGAFATAMGLGFVWYSLGVLRMPEGDKRMVPAKKLFAFSIAYLFAIFSALLVDYAIARIWLGGIV
ncbi:protoheme IX farnesyltransferase [Sinorhizobium meliloti]|nr:protoheme IX farnesyltransferase [Sinorhizobium meliloti]MDW9491195.1 protoheme IX farnesyltransferase [Sinorhizobium meliloti]MDW9559719.1 protoheme IX farnesyltransferase [Sinorhizobium meliloti]MDW9646994.1 protoheme IX farnesyltransferase [Sinorhizobium meliloti]MDW9857186.1 protoheme IX farnesyltransferase [Sinorhizobium meliloti]